MSEDVRFLPEHELGIAELPHFRKIQSCHLGVRRNAVPEEEFEPQIQQETKGEDETEQSGNTDEVVQQAGSNHRLP